MVCYGMVWYGMVWYGMVWYGMVWYGMVWYGMVWYGMVWYGKVRYVVVVVVGALSTCRREKFPDTLSLGRAQGSSRPAQRWPGGRRRRPRGGGVPPAVRGGGGRASLREGLPVRVTHAPSPAAGGGYAHLCETDAGWGAGGRDHLSGDLRGPGSPCCSHSPATGEGAYFLCEGGGGWGGGGYVWSIPLCPGSLACGQRGMCYGLL